MSKDMIDTLWGSAVDHRQRLAAASFVLRRNLGTKSPRVRQLWLQMAAEVVREGDFSVDDDQSGVVLNSCLEAELVSWQPSVLYDDRTIHLAIDRDIVEQIDRVISTVKQGDFPTILEIGRSRLIAMIAERIASRG